MIKLKVIKRWPIQHLRNIEIAKTVASGNSYAKTGKLFGISGNRVMQIYRVLMGKLCEQYFGVTYADAVYRKDMYNHPDRLRMIYEYEHFYKLEKGME